MVAKKIKNAFSVEFFGSTPISSLSMRQKFFRPIKKIAAKYRLIPKTMSGKKLLKKFVFGKLIQMPYEINETTMLFEEPKRISSEEPNDNYKVISCKATLKNNKNVIFSR